MQGRTGGIILAGGRGSRMHFQDKPLLTLGKQRIIDFIVSSALVQVDELIINVNRHPERFKDLKLPIIADDYGSEAGPLAGVMAGINWYCRHRNNTRFLACFPGDTPWFPDTIVRLMQQRMQEDGSEVAWLSTRGQLQPLFSVWSLSIAEGLADALTQGVYSPMVFIRSRSNTLVVIDEYVPGYFENINTPQDLRNAQKYAYQLFKPDS